MSLSLCWCVCVFFLPLMKNDDQEKKTSNRKKKKKKKKKRDTQDLPLSLSGDRGSDHITRCLLLPANRRPRHTHTHTHTHICARTRTHSCRSVPQLSDMLMLFFFFFFASEPVLPLQNNQRQTERERLKGKSCFLF